MLRHIGKFERVVIKKEKVLRRIIKKSLYIVPLILGLFALYGAMSGKIQEYIESGKQEYENVKKVSSTKEDSIVQEIPSGKIDLLEWFNNWDVKPIVEVYDPENKIAKNGVYGVTSIENSYVTDLYKKQEKLAISSKIPSEFMGSGIFNKEKIQKWGTFFENKNANATYEYSNFVIRDNFIGLDSKYYTDNKLINMLDENGKLVGSSMSNMENREVVTNVECKLVTFNIKITPHSDWVTERVAVPSLFFLREKGNALEYANNYCGIYGELDITACYPIYYDLGLYDIESAGINENIFCCPMRKGEEITFSVGYIVPNELMDNAYFVFNPDCYTATDYSYATEDIAIFKVS